MKYTRFIKHNAATMQLNLALDMVQIKPNHVLPSAIYRINKSQAKISTTAEFTVVFTLPDIIYIKPSLAQGIISHVWGMILQRSISLKQP